MAKIVSVIKIPSNWGLDNICKFCNDSLERINMVRFLRHACLILGRIINMLDNLREREILSRRFIIKYIFCHFYPRIISTNTT